MTTYENIPIEHRWGCKEEDIKLQKTYSKQQIKNLTHDQIKKTCSYDHRIGYNKFRIILLEMVYNHNLSLLKQQEENLEKFIKLANKKYSRYRFQKIAFDLFEYVTLYDLQNNTENGKTIILTELSKVIDLTKMNLEKMYDILKLSNCHENLFQEFIQTYMLNEYKKFEIINEFLTEYKEEIKDKVPSFFDLKDGKVKMFKNNIMKKFKIPFEEVEYNLCIDEARLIINGKQGYSKQFTGRLSYASILFLKFLKYDENMITEFIRQFHSYEKRYISSINIVKNRDVTMKILYELFDDLKIDKIEDINSISNNEIIKALQTLKLYKYDTYCLILDVLEDSEKKEALKAMSPPSIKNITVIKNFQLRGEWESKLLDDIKKEIIPIVNKNSTYKEERINGLLRAYVGCLEFINKYSIEKYNKQAELALKWFIYNCNKDMIKDVILQYCKTKECDQSRIKSTNPTHQGNNAYNYMLSMFKHGLKNYISCHTEILTFKKANFLNIIEDQAIPFDKDERRVISNEEYENMLKVVEENS